MSSIPRSHRPLHVGPDYWRSLDQLAETPEFRQWAEREFPAGAIELEDPLTRRHFVKIMSASFMLAGLGLSGCRRPEEKLVPFTRLPDDYVHGAVRYYATAMPNRSSAIPLLVRSNDGRPTKIEGNPQHPDSNGATDAFAQASILGLYDPDRSREFLRGGRVVPPQVALDALLPFGAAYGELGVTEATAPAGAEVPPRTSKRDGEGLCFLMTRSSSPSRARLQQLITERLPKAKWYVYEPVDFDRHRAAASLAFGRSVAPYYRLDAAKVILSLDSDFLGSEQDSFIHIRRFAAGRRLQTPPNPMSRLYAVEGLFTLTGMNADHRLRVAPSQVVRVAAQLARKVLDSSKLPGRWIGDLLAALSRLEDGLDPALLDPRWIRACADDLIAQRGSALVMAGTGQPAEVHLIALAMNVALGAVGTTLDFLPVPEDKTGSIVDLATELTADRVDTLVILGGNPVYNAPADLEWKITQRRARTIFRLGAYRDVTSAVSDWHLPMAHFLESWGDARTADGTLVGIQPLLEPWTGGLTEIELLARLAGLERPQGYDISRETFRGIAGEGEAKWRQFLHDGFLAGSRAAPVEVQLDWTGVAKRLAEYQAPPAPSSNRLEAVFHRDYSVDDGRYANNGWLQEWPDPITKLTWENPIMLSYRTAQALGIPTPFESTRSEVPVPRISVRLGEREIEGPAWIQPGMADFTIGLALGYGQSRTGRVGSGCGYDAYPLRTTTAPYHASGVQVTATSKTQVLATTQNHGAMEGRPAVREANLDQFRDRPDFASAMTLEQPREARPLYPNPMDVPGRDGVIPREKALHQWGMVIDLNACVGCSACVLACQSENNIPIVGKEQVRRSREMHWLRIDRYYAGRPGRSRAEQLADPQAVAQPMLCQHCESAPCESVCPVNATVHDDEGLNLMVYNRCVGTRYCSNNCPYKVRRFNFFDYHRRPLDELYRSPITSRTEGEWELWRWLKDPDRGSRPYDQWELTKLIQNPDVTVRMRGVMEKCTFCLQRLEQAKIARKIKARDSGDIQVPDGAVQTACQQACPAEAIRFGNLKDPTSSVSRAQADPRNYAVLEFLATRPRVTYLARIRNPNPAMPDQQAPPYTLQEYLDHQRSPFERQADAARAPKEGTDG